jgi:hypothetical protein
VFQRCQRLKKGSIDGRVKKPKRRHRVTADGWIFMLSKLAEALATSAETETPYRLSQ